MDPWSLLLAVLNGMLGAAFWLFVIRAMVRPGPNRDAVAFLATIVIDHLMLILILAVPGFAVDGPVGAANAMGIAIVNLWFWRSRGLTLTARAPVVKTAPDRGAISL